MTKKHYGQIKKNSPLKTQDNLKQAENGFQSRSSENGKTAVWRFGLKLHWYGLVWFGMVLFGMILFGLTIMDYHELS